MPNTVPAAAIGLPTINRRSALAKLGLGLAASSALAVTSAVAAPDAVSPELLRLIEAHKAANEVYLHAHDRHAEAVAICDTAPTHLPFSWPYKGSEHLEMSKGLEASLNNVRFLIGWRAADELNVAHRGLPEKRQKQIAAAYRGAVKDAEKIVIETFERRARILQSSGIEAAESDLASARAEDQDAMTALCDFRCVTLKEVQTRADYLSTLDSRSLMSASAIAVLPTSRVEA